MKRDLTQQEVDQHQEAINELLRDDKKRYADLSRQQDELQDLMREKKISYCQEHGLDFTLFKISPLGH